VQLTLTIGEVVHATPRARIARIALGGRHFSYRPGQAVMIATHGHPIRRAYSIASCPEDARRDGHLELLVGVDARGNPGAHLCLEPGTPVDVEGPIGGFAFPDASEDRRLVFIAGGIGIAPLRAMLRYALKSPNRQIGVIYSARTPADFAYELELQDLCTQGSIELLQTVSRDVTGGWCGLRGRIGRDHVAPLVQDGPALYFICGPLPLVCEVLKLLDEFEVPRDCIRIEDWLRHSAPVLNAMAGAPSVQQSEMKGS
jgi:ferredoxin-NADP reductase